MGTKKTFIAYADWIDYFDEDTTLEQAGEVFLAILRYQNGETDVKPEDPAVRMMFNKIKKTMRADAEAYAEKCAKNAENIRKRWKEKNTTEYDRIRSGTDTDTDTDTETDTETDTDNERPKGLKREKTPTVSKREPQKRFTPPTVEEVEAYCFERNNKVDAERFVDFYASNGWKVGKNPMKDWKAAVRTWEKRDDSNVVEMTKGQQARAAQNDILKAMYQGIL